MRAPSVNRMRIGMMAAAIAAVTCSSPAETPEPASAPRLGQPGKDIPWVPSPEPLVDRMLDIAQLNSSDFLIDLGSGDGRTVIAAARRGVRALGIEYDPDLVAFSTQQAERADVSWRATFQQGDIFSSDLDLSRATVITLFLSSEINLRLRPRLLDLEPGTRIVSNTFTMADWEPDAVAREGDCSSWCDAMLWIIPAKVEGEWRMDDGSLRLTQTFQRLSGDLAGRPIDAARLQGSDITFSVNGTRYTGRVSGSTMRGTRDDGQAWTASRR